MSIARKSHHKCSDHYELVNSLIARRSHHYELVSSLIAKRSHHKCSDHYELAYSRKLFKCEGCKMLGHGKVYQCKLCERKLHSECRYPKITVSHEYFAGSVFEFKYKPSTKLGKNTCIEYSKCCDACGQDICGFNYHCEKDNLDLHPCCLNLEKKLLIDKAAFSLRAKVSSKCMRCRKRKISDVPGWSYVSTCKNYHFHVYCLMEMVHEACMKSGERGSEKVELGKLAKFHGNTGSGGNKILEAIKPFLRVMLAALLGDPTLLICKVFLELVSL